MKASGSQSGAPPETHPNSLTAASEIALPAPSASSSSSSKNRTRRRYIFAPAHDPLPPSPSASFRAFKSNERALLNRRAGSEKHQWQQSQRRGLDDHPPACNGAVCSCAAGLTADCAAVCCCPFAVLHLLALAFIKLPAVVAWKVLVKLKKKLIKEKSPPDDVPQEVESPPSTFTPSWSYKESPEGEDSLTTIVRLDSQKLWKHFEGSHLGFGGVSIKRD